MSLEDLSEQQAALRQCSHAGSSTSGPGPTGTSTSEERREAAKLHKAAPHQLLAYAMHLCNLQDVQTFWDPVLDTKCVLAWNRQLMILAFRGTASMRNARTDIKVNPLLQNLLLWLCIWRRGRCSSQDWPRSQDWRASFMFHRSRCQQLQCCFASNGHISDESMC